VLKRAPPKVPKVPKVPKACGRRELFSMGVFGKVL
jgi:hypothetical protein